MRHVFLSYSHDDTDFVQILKVQLDRAGFSTWKDLDLEVGDTWHSEIENAIRDALAVIVILSEKAHSSLYVNFEWAFALGAGVPVLPLLLKIRPDSLHSRLRSLQALDFTNYVQRPWDALSLALKSLDEAERPFTLVVPRDAPPFIKKAALGLDSLDQRERIAAVKVLSQLSDSSVQDILAEAARHPAPDVRDMAAQALAGRRDLRAIPAIFDALSNGRYDRISSSTLCELGPQAAPLLLVALRDSKQHINIREGIAYALRTMLTDESVDALLELCRSPETNLRVAALKSLAGNSRAFPWIVEACQDNDPWVARVALESLTKYEGPEVVGTFVKALGDPEHSIRYAAAQGLAEVVDASAGPALVEALRDESPSLRSNVVKALLKLADRSLVPVLLDCLQTAPNSDIVDVLVGMNGEDVFQGMLVLLKSKQMLVRFRAAYGLGRLGDVRAVPDLILALQDEEDDVRRRAAIALGNLKAAASVPDLIAMLRREDEFDEVREDVAYALGEIGTREARLALRNWKARS